MRPRVLYTRVRFSATDFILKGSKRSMGAAPVAESRFSAPRLLAIGKGQLRIQQGLAKAHVMTPLALPSLPCNFRKRSVIYIQLFLLTPCSKHIIVANSTGMQGSCPRGLFQFVVWPRLMASLKLIVFGLMYAWQMHKYTHVKANKLDTSL